jgi:hypothetical protein
MFPSPSLGAPWLSASPSPAFGPCGIPFFVLELEEPEDGVEVVAGGDEDVDGVLEDDEEPPPQPAATSPRTTSASAGSARRFDRLRISLPPWLSSPETDAGGGRTFPAAD